MQGFIYNNSLIDVMANINKISVDELLKRRVNVRKEILLHAISLLNKKHKCPVSTLEIYHHSFKKGYSYSYKTLHKDLLDLRNAGSVKRELDFMGKGNGTKSRWSIK